MPKLVWLNHRVLPLEQATASVADHAYLYGDGLFEGIRIYNRRVFKLDEHIRRLLDGAHYMQYEMAMTAEEVRAIVLDLCQQAGIAAGYIRINLTRGTGLGLDPKAIDRKPNLMVMVNELALYPPESYQQGLSMVTCSYRVIPPDSLDPRLKCIGRYAANILAKMEANRLNAGEGLMLNHRGEVAECTGDNIFLVKNGTLFTPHINAGILAGITRATVIELARADGLEVVEDILTRYDVLSSDECFLTGTAAEVIPAVSLDGRLIGTGQPGPVTRRIMELFRAETENGTPF